MRPRNLIVLLLLGLLGGCATSGTVRTDASKPWKQYCAAVSATRIPAAKNLSRDLVAIVRSTPRLRWNDKGQVLMASLVGSDCQSHGAFCPDQAGKPVTLADETWLSAVPFLRDFCQGVPKTGLKLRLLQRLGIAPAGVPVDVVVQMWIDPKDFFRPCIDREVTDGVCELSLAPDAGTGSDCPWTGATGTNVGWMCKNWKSSYPPTCGPGTEPIPFPWTGLGYTWDWAADNPTHHGESEFVAPKGTAVTIESVKGIGEYCGPPPASAPGSAPPAPAPSPSSRP
jgi:hypothetical protein